MSMVRKLLLCVGVLLLAAALGTCVGLVSGCAGESGAQPFYSPVGPQPSPSARLTELPAVNRATPGHVVTLPAVTSSYTATAGAPVESVEIRDCAGELADTGWLSDRFGAVSWSVAGVGPHLRTLWSCCGNCPAAHVVHVENEDGGPVAGMPVVLHWPQAPWLPSELYNCGLMRGVVGYTNASGDVGFGLGGGAYYWPPAGGPHVVWLGNSGDCLDGIGMLAATNHEHVDSGWRVPAGQIAALDGLDRVFVPGTLVYQVDLGGGRVVPVVVWPEWGWER